MTYVVQSMGKCDNYFVTEKIISTVSLIFMKLLISTVFHCEDLQKQFNKETMERKNFTIKCWSSEASC